MNFAERFLTRRGVDLAPDETAPGASRREFLVTSILAGGGLVLAVSAVPGASALAVSDDDALPPEFQPNAFLRLGVDGSITIYAKHDEMGQGIHTGLAIALCEELEVNVADVTVVPAPANPAYAHSAWGLQGTGGSTSTWSSFQQMRQAGATAREMLIAAAARRWRVTPADCVAANGEVRRRNGGAALAYRDLVNDAAEIPNPADVKLKTAEQWTQIGKPTRRVDSESKTRGAALFALDRRPKNCLTAVVARSPYFGGSLRSYDDADARAMPGVRDVVQIPSGVAVIADGFWAAYKAREALKLDWAPGPGAALDSERLLADYRIRAQQRGIEAEKHGDVAGALADADQVIEATYEVPFQAHAPMEPLNCIVTLRPDGGADIITGSQFMGIDHMAAARRLGVGPEKVNLENSYLGGGFGRRANPASDWTVEAVDVALAARRLGRPIQTVWSREDDIRGGYYRPMYVNAMQAGFKNGELAAWRHHIVGQSVISGTPFAAMLIQNGVDTTTIEGAAEQPYDIPNRAVELTTIDLEVPVLWWRSVGHSNTAFAKESFIDECAAALGRDPYEYRRHLIKDHPRHLRVLDHVAEKAGWWTRELPPGVGRGISVHESFQSFVGHVVEASVENGRPKIHRIVCSVDCGPVVNPDQVRAQLEGGTIFALSAVLGSEITFTNGRVDQSNFHDFNCVRMNEAPPVEAHIVDSADSMGGIGEVAVPGVASAVCSAIADACGVRIRRLPIGDQLA